MSKLSDLLRNVAPTLAGVLGSAAGGPLVGAAVKTLGEKLLGKSDATVTEVEDAVAALPPDKLVELRTIDTAFKIRMTELGYRPQELEIEDRKDARARDAEFIKAGRRNERGDNLAYLAVGGLLLAALLLFLVDISQSQKEVLIFILGVLSKIVGDVYAFEFGSSKGEQKKDNAMTKWLDEGDKSPSPRQEPTDLQ